MVGSNEVAVVGAGSDKHVYYSLHGVINGLKTFSTMIQRNNFFSFYPSIHLCVNSFFSPSKFGTVFSGSGNVTMIHLSQKQTVCKWAATVADTQQGPSELPWEPCLPASGTQARMHVHTRTHMYFLKQYFLLLHLIHSSLPFSISFYPDSFHYIKARCSCLTKLISCSSNELQL